MNFLKFLSIFYLILLTADLGSFQACPNWDPTIMSCSTGFAFSYTTCTCVRVTTTRASTTTRTTTKAPTAAPTSPPTTVDPRKALEPRITTLLNSLTSLQATVNSAVVQDVTCKDLILSDLASNITAIQTLQSSLYNVSFSQVSNTLTSLESSLNAIRSSWTECQARTTTTSTTIEPTTTEDPRNNLIPEIGQLLDFLTEFHDLVNSSIIQNQACKDSLLAKNSSSERHRREQKIKGIIAHEICHYVMRLVYQFEDNPFYENDKQTREEYCQVINYIEDLVSINNDDECDGIISTVFKLYNKVDSSAELIVRPVQIQVQFGDNQAKMIEIEEKFKILFNFCRHRVIPEVENFSIQQRQDIKLLNDFVGILNEISYSEIIFRKGVNADEVFKHQMAIVTTNVPKMLLFNIFDFINTSAFDLLSTQNIFINTQMLKNNFVHKNLKLALEKSRGNLQIFIDCSINFSKSFNFKIFKMKENLKIIFIVDSEKNSKELSKSLEQCDLSHEKVIKNFNWMDLATESQNEQLKVKICFQNCHFLSLSELIEYQESSDMSSLVDENLLNLLINNERINVNPNLIKDQIFEILNQSRNLIQAKVKAKQQNNSWQPIKPKIQTQKSLFEDILQFLSQTLLRRHPASEPEFQNIQLQTEKYEKCEEMQQNQVLERIKNQKYVLISDRAGSGKSWMLKSFTNLLKKHHLIKWTTYVDLKQFINDFKGTKDDVEFANFIADKILKSRNNFEAEIFKKLYKNGKVCILFDGFDEISPDCAEFVSKLCQRFEQNGGNQLWIATRDYFEVDLQEMLSLDTVYKLDDFTEEQAVKLIATSWALHDEKPQNYEIYKDSATELIKRIADKKSITIGHPQFYKMVADITVNDKKLIFDFTMLKMFKKCVDIHYERWSHQKGDLRKDQCIQSSHKTFNFHNVHEFLAMKSLYPDEVEFGDLKLSDLDWNDEEIIACGMLNKVGDYFLFPHETFREYYAAKFIIRIIKKSENLSFEILNYFIEFLTIKNFGVIRMFINDALADEADFLKIESKMSNEFCASLCESKSIVNIFFENLENLLNFVIKIFKNSKNQKLFKQLLFASNKIFLSATTNSSLFINIQNLIIEHFNVNDLIEILSSNKIILSIFGSPLATKDIQIFLNKIDKKIGSKFINKELKLKNEHEHNLLLRIIQVDHQVDNVETLEDIFEIIMKYLNNDEIIKLSKETGLCSRNVFQACIRTGDLIKIKFFWTKLEEIYKSQKIHHEFKKLISHKAVEYSNRCPIQEAAYCSDIKFHETFWELLLKTFNNRQELMDLILQEDTNFGNFIHHQVSQSSDFVVEFTLEKFKELFTNDQYLELLFSKHQSGMNLLQTAAFDSKNIKVHQLLWKIIKNACKSDQEFLKVIQHVDMLGFNLFQIASYQATSEIFKFMLQELESLTTFEEIRKILGNKSWTLFFHSFKLNNSLKYQQYLWTVIRKYLHKSEVLEMMTFVDDNEKYLCTVAARNSKSIADYTWKEIDSFLESDLMDVMVDLVDIRLDLGATELDLTAAELDLTATELDLTDTELDLTATKLDLTATKLDLRATEFDFTATKLDLTATELDLTATKLDLTYTDLNLTATKLDLTAPELDLTATDIDLTATNLDLTATEIDLTATKLDLIAKKLDLTATKLDLTATKLDLTATKLDLTDAKLDLTASELNLTDKKLDLTTTKLDLTAIELDLTATDIDLTAPNLDLTATELDLTDTKLDLTATKHDLTATELDLTATNLDLTDTELDLTATDIDLTATNLDLTATEIDLTATKLDLTATELDLTATELDLTDTKLDLTATEHDLTATKLDLTASELDLTDTELDLTATELDLRASELDLTATELDLTATKLDLRATKLDLTATEIDLTATKLDLRASELDLIATKLDLTASELNLTDKKLDLTTTKLDLTAIELDLTATDIDLTAPNLDLTATELDLTDTKLDLTATKHDLTATELDLTATKLDLTATKLDLTATDLDLTATKLHLTSTDLNLTATKLDLTAPELDLTATDIDLTATNLDLTATEIDLRASELDLTATELDLTATKLDLTATEIDLTATKLDLTATELDLTATKLDLTATEIDLTATKLDLTATKLDLTASELDLTYTDLNLTATKLDLTAPELDLTAPELDLTAPELDLTATNLDLTATEIDLTAPELDLTATDIDLTATNLDLTATEIDLRASELDLTATELDLTATKLDLTATEIDLTATKLDLTATKLDLTASELDLTDTELDLTATKLDLTAPELDLTAPELDLTATELDLTATNLDLAATKLDLTASELNLTDKKLDLTTTNLDLTATELDLTASKLDLTATDLDLTAKMLDLTAIQSSRAFYMNPSSHSHRSYLLTSLKDETRQALLNFSSNVHDCQLRMSFESKLQEFVILFRAIDSQNLMKRVISDEISIKDSNVLFRLSFCDDIEFHRMLWTHISSIDTEDLCKLMLVENIIGNNFAFCILSNDNFEVIKFTFEKFKEIFNNVQYLKIIKSKGYLNRNILEFSIVKSKNIKIIKFLWNILQDSSKDFLNLLKENEENIFQIAAKFSTAEIFGFMINELEIVAKSDEINYFFTKLNHFNENLLQLSAKFNKSQKLHEQIWMSIDKHLNKCQINEAINHTNKLGDNVLYIAVYHNSREIVEFTWTKIKEKIVKKCDQIEYLKKNGHKKCSLYEYSVTDNINNVEVKDFIKELVKDYEKRHFTLILIFIFLLLCVGMFLVLSNL
ncbi:unnamed protein product [Chironomus riparius]|uniref:NACHT domain-containing protein n=1 Tax=Chironomus riparius TaxID=315576 RepID=A0A9N9WYP6_9DIPT|nr:unnamed protein product [Chironomus riparius]